ncbi:MAG: hypothetical protein NTW28_17930 [Candidatus Solibacter sp.]|nr:hypothetical protein [Candidatus Solibacter sp.]
MAKPVNLNVNGVRHSVHADPPRTVLSVLRDDLRLTGTLLLIR